MNIVLFSFECGGYDHRLMRGGLSPLVWNLAREYAGAGHRVSVVTPAHGHLDTLRSAHRVEELDYRHDHDFPLVLDRRTWPDHPEHMGLPLSTRAHGIRVDGVDVYLLSNSFLDLLPDRIYPPPAFEGRDLAYCKPLVFQAEGVRFVDWLHAGEPAVVHAFEPFYHYVLPLVWGGDPLRRTVSTVAANAPITQSVYRPQVERLLESFGVTGLDLAALEPVPPVPGSPDDIVERTLAGTRMHERRGDDHVAFLPLVAAHADLVDFVSPGQREWFTSFEGSPFDPLFRRLPVSRLLRDSPERLLDGGCGVSDSWLARDPGAVDRADVLRSLGLSPRRPTFYHASRYAVHHKGQLELMRAVENVLAEDRDVNFVIRCSTGSAARGAEPANAHFQGVADRYPDNVHLTWELADEDLLFRHAAVADFCVYPSKYELDGFLIAQAEAMACGSVPIGSAQRVTDHFGHALPHDDPRSTGFAVRRSFRDGDADLTGELTARIREALRVWREEPDLYQRLSDRARSTARSFTWERSARTRLDGFARILEGDTRRASAPVTASRAPVVPAPTDPGEETGMAPRRCRTRRGPDGLVHVEYQAPGVERVEAVASSSGEDGGPRSPGQSAAEARASDEAVPADANAPVLVPLEHSEGLFHGSVTPPPGGHLVLLLTRGSGSTEWESVPAPLRAGRPRAVPPYRLVATDLDGTLLRDDRSLSPRNRKALALVAEAGAHHLVVTGRPASACRRLFGDIGYRGLAVCGQGAQLYDAARDALLFSAELDRDLARSVVEGVQTLLGEPEMELGVVTAAPEGSCVVTGGFRPRIRHGWSVTRDRSSLWKRPIDKVLLQQPNVADEKVVDAATRAAEGRVSVVHSDHGIVELLPSGTDKARGLARAAELLGCGPEHTVAFGNMPNDIPLLAWADHGVAVADAHPDLLAVADETVPAHDRDGVAVALEWIFAPHHHAEGK
ncbi:HAD hydrolase family protein [Nocardiopsis halotolerans]|uniref:HAD hydrolase family protein n=1 Tax=Nocardiopsis halotolerans TaxID=124252 RepID=UPI00034535E4|nr:HAD hydrolase family protein [Nocardiopsis halotolerans]